MASQRSLDGACAIQVNRVKNHPLALLACDAKECLWLRSFLDFVALHPGYACYDWHAGLGAPIPGFGNVKDDDALCLISANMAKEFMMNSTWSQTSTYDSISGTFSWGIP